MTRLKEYENATAVVLALLACGSVTFVLGSIHSFSVFLAPIEAKFGVGRAVASLNYSTALVALTASVLWGPRWFNRISPFVFVLMACVLACLGLLTAMLAENIFWYWIGYGILFGLGNGLGYGYVLQLGARVMYMHRGMAMGFVTAAYAFGAIFFSGLLGDLIVQANMTDALFVLAMYVIITGCIAALILKLTGVRFDFKQGVAQPGTDSVHSSFQDSAQQRTIVCLIWLAYFLSVFSGLMAIGHATGVVANTGVDLAYAAWGAIIVSTGSGAAGLLSGWLSDIWPVKKQLLILPVLASCALLVMSQVNDPTAIIGLMCLVGFSYGAVITVYPVAINKLFGDLRGPEVYGRVFTAWGMAGIAGPWLAGFIFDNAGSYGPAFIIASIAALFGAGIVLFRFKFPQLS